MDALQFRPGTVIEGRPGDRAPDPGGRVGPPASEPDRGSTSAGPPEREVGPRDPSGERLTETERRQLEQLQRRDREVRAHEQAHKAAGGRYAGAISYDFETGPDGRRYAVGGEVPIDLSEVPGDPEATVEKMRVVRRAALAPAEPSTQDRAVAAEAAAVERQARAEARQRRGQDPTTGAPANV
jgi:hypothetical protein